ncbi:hypothetical protein GCM10010389_40580 [Streptomyces echinoruber]|uniref:Uncharacterized protein n=1 Tax=Streptomyces echinoruber TaxID=68898 RepID=A0A918REW8_9ACTN|nr:hypothetical protein GCM10010389_40580 [Streptomyces echinoruber]
MCDLGHIFGLWFVPRPGPLHRSPQGLPGSLTGTGNGIGTAAEKYPESPRNPAAAYRQIGHERTECDHGQSGPVALLNE